MGKCVYILGAGFSKAVDNRMYLLSELSSYVYEALGENWRHEWGKDLQENVELLLTYLGSSNPWQEPAEHSSALNFYYQIEETITNLIVSAEVGVINSLEPNPWLQRLIEVWHNEQAAVITFNYDTLIEQAVPFASTEPYELHGPNLYEVPITPAPARYGMAYHRFPAYPTFSLLKLHGSLNWWYSGPGSPPGDSVYGTNLAGQWGNPLDNETWDAVLGGSRSRVGVEDKRRLIVPPTLAKERFYSNTVMKEQWRRARHRLMEAERIVFMGYSLPEFDLASRLLVSTAQQGCTVDVVDKDPESGKRIGDKLPSFNVSQVSSGENSINRYALDRREQFPGYAPTRPEDHDNSN